MSVNLLYAVAGRYANILEHATLTSSSEDTNRPLAHLAIGRPSMPFAFSAAGEDDYVEADLSRVQDGDFEGTTLTDEWTDASVGASNAVAYEDTIINAGAQALKVTLATAGAGNLAGVYRDVVARSGQTWHVQAALRGDGTVSARLRVLIVETGQWVQDDGSLSTVADVAARATASYADSGIIDFTLPTYAVCKRELLTLRVYCLAAEASNTGVAYFDDVALWPSWDWASFHGIAVGDVDIQLRSSSDAFDADDQLVDTVTADIPVCYTRLDTPVADRWARVVFSGTNHEAIEIGEWVLAEMGEFTEPNRGLSDEDKWWDITNDGPTGEQSPVIMSRFPRRSLTLDFTHFTRAEQLSLRREISNRSHGPTYPIVACLPDEGICILGRKDQLWKARLRTPSLSEETSLVIAESAFSPCC